MLRSNILSNSLPRQNDLTVAPNLEVNKIFELVDKNISGFCSYYQTIKDSERENRISDFLQYYLNVCLRDDSQGFLPFNFGKNPTQENSGKETDLGVVLLTKGVKPITLVEFEAKRFSESSNNTEYVYGERGGIERFKRSYHSSHLTICGMLGYVQSRTSQEWIGKVNDWIEELSKNNTDTTIDWTISEKLSNVDSLTKVEKLTSSHSRQVSNDVITLWHYFIELN